MARRSILCPVLWNNSALGGIFHNRCGAARDILRRATDGQIHVTLQSARKRWAAAEMKSIDIGGALTLLASSTDLPCLTLDGVNGYVGYYGLLATAVPGLAAGSVHEKRQALSGALWMDSFDWQEGGDAEISVRGLFDSTDGSVEPLQYSSASLPAIPVNAAAYDLTALVVNGATVNDVSSFSAKVDPKFTMKRHPGSVLGRGVFTDGSPLEWTISAACQDLSVFRTAGGAGGTGAVSAVFTKRANNGGLGANTVTWTINSRWILPGDESADINGEAGGEVQIIPRYDGSNKPVTWAIV